MLELRPNCQMCDRDLPPQSADARICSYECTYCADCVASVLHNVCPTCGGGFVPRPIRPRQSWRQGWKTGLDHHPADQRRRYLKFDQADVLAHVARIRHLAPEER